MRISRQPFWTGCCITARYCAWEAAPIGSIGRERRPRSRWKDPPRKGPPQRSRRNNVAQRKEGSGGFGGAEAGPAAAMGGRERAAPASPGAGGGATPADARTDRGG